MSINLAWPAGVISRFDGLMSRCTTLRWAAWARASATCKRVAHGLGQRQRALAVHQVANIDPLDELENDVVQPAVFAHIVDAGDVVVIEPRGRLGLVLEPQHRLAVGRVFRREDFQGHAAGQAGIEGAEHLAHPAATDILQQLEVPQPFAGQNSSVQDPHHRIGPRIGRQHRTLGNTVG